MSVRRPAILLAGALLALPPAPSPAQPSGRHGDGHTRHHDWYKDLRQPDTGVRCCNGSVDGSQGDRQPAAFLHGRGRVLPRLGWPGVAGGAQEKSKILQMQTPDRGTHLCELYGKVFCFITEGPSS